MYRRVFAAILVACFLVVFPASAASRRQSDQTFLQRIIQKIRQVVALDTADPFPPKP